jgi:tRNA 5-methylaminomethyl-2-thiouridine biosynthesis bifunctional protein
MNRSNTSWRPMQIADLDWSSGTAPRSSNFGDFYYSTDGGLQESDYVFLQGNQLPDRWDKHDHPVFCIVETGFGTGLNFLLTWSAWQACPAPRPRLHYISVEKHPLGKSDLARALASWSTLAENANHLLDRYPDPVPGQHRIILAQGDLILDLWWEDVTDAISDMASREQQTVDAWYLDGFSPARNKTMWQDALFSGMATASRLGSTFATFTAASNVRRGLEEVGFKVEKAPGFGQKRECLRGSLDVTSPPPVHTDTPWDIPHRRSHAPTSALVIGAGLAGCTVASALAHRGISVTILEQNQLASAGSGNDQGILYTRLSQRHSALSDFALQSFLFAHRFYRDLLQTGELKEGEDGALCGSYNHSERQEEMSALAAVLEAVPGIAQIFDAMEATKHLGFRQLSGGYWFPKSGWMSPGSVCRALVSHSNIQLLENTGSVALEPAGSAWRAVAGDQLVAEADCAIIATGTAGNSQRDLSWLPLQAIRGQTTNIPSTAAMTNLKSGLCHSGYIAPARARQHCIGATFDLDDHDDTVRVEDHRRNIEALAIAMPEWRDELRSIEPANLSGRVGYRCATPDYLPVVGAVPDYEAFLHSFADLRKNAKQTILQRGPYIRGLYVTTGHGSRGLTSTPLAAQVLASQICGELPPVSGELYRAIAPGRFIVRQLRRGLI